VHALVSSVGFTSYDPQKNSTDFGDIEAVYESWYRWFLNTPMGKRGLEQNREGFTRKLWQL
jgi:hypothetical protein